MCAASALSGIEHLRGCIYRGHVTVAWIAAWSPHKQGLCSRGAAPLAPVSCLVFRADDLLCRCCPVIQNLYRSRQM